MAINQTSNGGDDGTQMGQSATDKIGFYGKAPVAQPALIADATDAATVITRANSILAALRTLGLIAT